MLNKSPKKLLNQAPGFRRALRNIRLVQLLFLCSSAVGLATWASEGSGGDGIGIVLVSISLLGFFVLSGIVG
jgi:hypothetical protein